MRVCNLSLQVADSFEQAHQRGGERFLQGDAFAMPCSNQVNPIRRLAMSGPSPQQCPGKVHIMKLEEIGRIWVAWSPCCKINSASYSEIRVGAFSGLIYCIAFGQNKDHFVLLPYQLEEG